MDTITDVGADATTFRTSEILMERHGADAVEFAERQAERLETLGYAEAAGNWRAIARMIGRLQSVAPRPDKTWH
jgi:hypothetical protein